MKTLIIFDRQPVLRLGLKLVIQSHWQSLRLHEIGNIGQLTAQTSPEDVSVIILGLDLEYDKINPKILRSIKQKFPACGLIVYTDYLQQNRVFSSGTRQFATVISKRASETEFVSCLRSVLEKQKDSLL